MKGFVAVDDFMNAMSDIFPILIIVTVIFAAIIWIVLGKQARSIKKAPILTRHGKVIEKTSGTYERVIVEYDNGERQSLVDLKQTRIFVVGDTGTFSTQKHSIVSFERD